MASKSSKIPAVAEYDPTEKEFGVIDVVHKKMNERPRAPAIKMKVNETTNSNSVSYEHVDHFTAQLLVMSELGTGDARFYTGMVQQLASLGEYGMPVSENATNFAMSVIRAVDPQNELETMLAAQMGAVHQATMMMAKRLNNVSTIPQQDAAERAFNKLARTYSMQMDTLKRYRAKAQQTVRVERVTVNDGGQAIVGAVQTGGRGDEKN